MIIVRDVFTAKPGKASKLAKLLKSVFSKESHAEVFTDYIGNFNTVILETRFKSLGEWEKQISDYKSGKLARELDPSLMEEWSKYTDLYVTGKREILQVVE